MASISNKPSNQLLNFTTKKYFENSITKIFYFFLRNNMIHKVEKIIVSESLSHNCSTEVASKKNKMPA